MPLQSELFAGDRALEACLVQDSAHVLTGARGPHVAKIQQALALLDGALISSSEITTTTYGSTTKAAVLTYKRARSIINYSYQKQADDIVGKMTIAALDREMALAEGRKMHRCCPDPVRGGGAPSRTAVASVGDSNPQFPRVFAVLQQLVSIGDKMGKQSFPVAIELPRKANEILAPYGMRVGAVNGYPFSFPRRVRYGSQVDFEGLRKAAETSMPGFDFALRVLICPFRLEDGQDDMKTNGASFSIDGFKRFVVLNSNLLRADRGTLLHEMIHCSHELMMGEIGVHDDADPTSVFSIEPNRTRLTLRCAERLTAAFFAHPRGV